MKNGLLHSIVKIESLAAILFVLTIVLVVVFQTFTREFTIDAQTANWMTEASDDRQHGGTSFTEDLSSENEFSFSYRTEDTNLTSFAVFLLSPATEDSVLDLDWFTEVTMKARAKGEGKQQFLLYLRDRPDHLTDNEDSTTCKYNEAFVQLTEQSSSISLPRDSFVVPRWWVAEKAVVPEDVSATFSHVEWIEIAVCNPSQANSGVVVIEEICFRGPLITPAIFYRILFGTWGLLAIPLCFQVFLRMKKTRAIRRIRQNQAAQQKSPSKTDLSISSSDKRNSDTIELQRTDELTGVLTNFGMQDAINEALQAVRNGEAKASIILVDIDDMELINRAHGMATGDALIIQVSEILKEGTARGLTIGRWKDDKFVVICLGQDRVEAKDVACLLRKRIDEETTATCSFGVHQLNPINTFEEAYDRASKCIQEAKFNGKNKVVLFNLRTSIAPFPNSAAAHSKRTQPTNLTR